MYRKRNDELTVLGLFAGDYSRQLYLREISNKAKIPLKTTQTVLQKLEQQKILQSSINGKNKYFKLNLENIQTKLWLEQTELFRTSLFLEKYPQFKTFLKSITVDFLLIIFGSFARFQAEKDSDVDVLVVSKRNEKLPSFLLPLKIQGIELSEKGFIQALEKKETLIKEIAENHIIVNNHSFYVRIMWNYYAQ